MDGPSPFDDGSGGPVQLEFVQVSATQFTLPRSFRYRSSAYEEPFVVPTGTVTTGPDGQPDVFETDLMSVPRIFAWFVPAMGRHLPAVLLHDALVLAPGEPKRHDGPDVDRVAADRIFRDALGDLEVPRVRRWIIWASVALATTWAALRPKWRWRLTILLTFAAVAALGTIATLDVTDAWDVLPWMGDEPWWREILLGGAAALVIPAVMSLAWWNRAHPDRVGVALILGVGLAFFLHITAAILVVTLLYQGLEWVVSKPEGRGPNLKKNLESAPATNPS